MMLCCLIPVAFPGGVLSVRWILTPIRWAKDADICLAEQEARAMNVLSPRIILKNNGRGTSYEFALKDGDFAGDTFYLVLEPKNGKILCAYNTKKYRPENI